MSQKDPASTYARDFEGIVEAPTNIYCYARTKTPTNTTY